MSWFFVSGGQSIGVSASAPVLPMNIQDWSPLGWIGWISLPILKILLVITGELMDANLSWDPLVANNKAHGNYIHTYMYTHTKEDGTGCIYLQSPVANKERAENATNVYKILETAMESKVKLLLSVYLKWIGLSPLLSACGLSLISTSTSVCISTSWLAFFPDSWPKSQTQSSRHWLDFSL